MTDRGGDRGGVEGNDGPADRGAPEVIVALDHPEAGAALELVDRLPEGTWYKVGLELFAAEGPALVERLAGRGHPIFLDLKLHDIPNTVAGATRAAARLGVRLLTVHASGGSEMIRAASEAAGETSGRSTASAGEGSAAGDPGDEGLRILAVTVLTSLDDALLGDVMGREASVEASVGRLAALAYGAGADGAVASVDECTAIKAICGPDFGVATPGIRLPGGEAHDQKRVATPADARAAGADWLVVGRAITAADDPVEALERVREAAAG